MTTEADKLLAAIVAAWDDEHGYDEVVEAARAYLANPPAMVEVDVMADPRVQALVDALQELAIHPEDCGDLMPGDFRDYYRDTCNFAAAALASAQAACQAHADEVVRG